MHALHKILAAHSQPRRGTVTPGEYLQLVPDVFAFGISYNAEEADKFEATLVELGVKEFPLRERIFAFQDHGAPAPSPAFAAGQKRWREVIRSRGVAITDPGAGISHLQMTEGGIVGPGTLLTLRCMETLDPTFAARVQPGDIIVGGRNFGAGSSTPVHLVLQTLGIAAVVAESFNRIFFRSSISAGLLVHPCAGILALANTGDRIEVDAVAGRISNLTSGKQLVAERLPDFLREMIAMGGEIPYIKAQLAAAK